MDPADELLRRKLSELIGRSGKTHGELAAALTSFLGLDDASAIQKYNIDEFCRISPPGENRGARFPAYLVAPMCEALGSDKLARLILPERLRQILAVGELAINSHETLARALAELEKIVKSPAEQKPLTRRKAATGKRSPQEEKF